MTWHTDGAALASPGDMLSTYSWSHRHTPGHTRPPATLGCNAHLGWPAPAGLVGTACRDHTNKGLSPRESEVGNALRTNLPVRPTIGFQSSCIMTETGGLLRLALSTYRTQTDFVVCVYVGTIPAPAARTAVSPVEWPPGEQLLLLLLLSMHFYACCKTAAAAHCCCSTCHSSCC